MKTQPSAASGAYPSLILICHKFSKTKVVDHQQIADHADPVVGSIAIVQMSQSPARKFSACGAAVCVSIDSFLTGLDFAGGAGFRFAGIAGPTARARVSFPHVSAADTAINAAGSNQAEVRRYRCNHFGH
jgi:hypothetical protein